MFTEMSFMRAGLFILLFFIYEQIYAKKELASVSGLVLNNQQDLMPFATVALFKVKDSTLWKAATTDIDGRFEFTQVPYGEYNLTISFVGYQSHTQALTISQSQVSLPNIVLKGEENVLQEVEVSAVRPLVEVKADKTVFNVEGTINASGSDALSLLKKAPGVTVDNNNNISLKGKGGVVVYLDDKKTILSNEDLASYLQTLNSAQIQNIEIMSNPSSKYDAEGAGGIINIRLKKQQQENANAIFNGSYVQGFYPKWDASITSNYKKKNINVFLNYGYGDRIYRSFQHFDRLQSGSQFQISSIHKSTNRSHNFKAGADYHINDESTIGFQINGDIVPKSIWQNNTSSNIGLQNANFDQILASQAINPSTRNNMSYNLNYRYRDTLDRSFTFDIDRSHYLFDLSSKRQNIYYDYQTHEALSGIYYNNDIHTDIDLWSSKADYEQKLWKGKFSVGAKYTKAKTANSFDFYDVLNGVEDLNEDRTNDFSYSEEIVALYSIYNFTWKKWSVQSGLRYENTHSIGNLVSLKPQNDKYVERFYDNYFPNVGISYDLGKESSWGASYSRRIDRPDYQMLNPFEYKLDELTYRKGNPFLQPEYINTYELNYTYKGFLTLSTSFSKTKNFYADVLLPYSSYATVETPYNLSSSTSYNFSPSISVPIKKWWFLYSSTWINLLHNQANLGDGNLVDVQALFGGIYLQNTITLPKEINLEVSGWFDSGGIWQGNMKTGPMGALDLGFQKKIMKKRGTLKLSITDVFFTSKWTVDAKINGMSTTGGGGWESRLAKVNFTYIIGNDKLKAERRKTALEEEQQRMKGKD